MSSKPTLGYFKTRGLAQPIRLLLKFVGVEFNDKRYEFGSVPDFTKEDIVRKDWLAEKFTLGLDFPNIPYYIDGDIKLTQILTILRFLGQKHGLMATEEESLIREDLIEQEITDIWALFSYMICNITDNREDKQKKFDELIAPQLQLLSKFLSKNKWFVRRITYVDFLAYEILDCIRLFNPQTFEDFPLLKHYLIRFESLEPIKRYMLSPEFLSWPTTGPFNKWGFYK